MNSHRVDALSSMARIFRRLDSTSILALLLLLFTMNSVTLGLSALVSYLDLTTTGILATLAVLMSWGLARTRLRIWQAGLALLLSGATITVLGPGAAASPVWTLILRIKDFLVEVWQKGLGLSIRSQEQIRLAISDLLTVLSTITNHMVVWVQNLLGKQSITDSMVVLMLWSLAIWIVGAWAGWVLRRHHRPLLAILPGGILLAGALNFVRTGPYYLVTILGASFFLLVIVSQQLRERQWEERKIDYSTEIRLDLAFTTIPLVIVILVVAVVTPSISIREVAQFARRLTEQSQQNFQRAGQMLGLKPEAGAGGFDERALYSGLPNIHLLGSGPELAHKTVMTIQTGDFPPGPPESLQNKILPPYHWRGFSFDTYNGQGWSNGPIKNSLYRANEIALLSANPAYRLVQIKVNGVEDLGSLVYSTGPLVSVDQAFQVAWRASPDDIAQDRPVEEISRNGDQFGATTGKNSYQVKSLFADIGTLQLKSAGENYPEWVKKRYLDLPLTIPMEVAQLAHQVADSQPTSYDKAKAIELYLRTNYTYTLDVPAPPADLDVADYFLFDLKRGYCDYYATAMAVMDRAVGIPTRFVIGYARGTYDPETARYIVTEADAHAWVEVYFPTIGWVEFEPTAGRPSIDRPEIVPAESSGPAARGLSPREVVDLLSKWLQRGWQSWLIVAGLLSILIFLGWQIWLLVDAWLLRRLTPSDAVARLYHRFYRQSRSIIEPILKGYTPYEFAAALAHQLSNMLPTQLIGRIISPAVDESREMTEIFAQIAYSLHPMDEKRREQAFNDWKRLRIRLWLLRLIKPRHRGLKIKV